MSSISALLSEAPQGRHFCQLHKNQQTLAAAAGIFAGAGMKRGDAVIVIAADANVQLVLKDLQCAGLDATALQESGMLTVLNSEAVLNRFMRDGMPDWEAFRQTVAPIIEAGQEAMRRSGGKNLRVYGEMVNDLWHAGNSAAAIRLEEYWNELAREYRYCLFCGYELDGLNGASYSGPIAAIARTHSDVLSTDDDERLLTALDAASRDILAIPLSAMLSYSGLEAHAGEHRLPIARRTILWLQRNIPSAMDKVLRRAQHYYQETA